MSGLYADAHSHIKIGMASQKDRAVAPMEAAICKSQVGRIL
jgi:hypothetical protein